MSVCRVIGKEEDGDVRGVDDSAGEALTFGAKFSFIAIACGIYEYDRADTWYFNPFADGVGGGAGTVADKGDLLACDSVDQSGFAAVGGSEECYLCHIRTGNPGHRFLFPEGA